MAGETTKDYDFTTSSLGNKSAGTGITPWGGSVEFHDSHQLAVVNNVARSPRLQSGYFETHPGDNWAVGNNTIRSLLVANSTYQSNETTGQEYWWGISFRVGALADTPVIWELHNTQSLYKLPGNIAPHALLLYSGQIQVRTATGNWSYSGTSGGASYFFPHQVISPTIPTNTWITCLAHYIFSETSGTYEWWIDTSGSIDSTFGTGTPALRKTGVPTMQYSDQINYHNDQLYQEVGIYTGTTTTPGQTIIYWDGVWRRMTRADAVAAVIGSGGGGGGGGTGSTVVEAPGAPYRIGVTSVDTAAATPLADDTNQKRGSITPNVVPNDAGTVVATYEYGACSTAASTRRKMALYALDSGGNPVALIGVSNEKVLTSQTAAWWPYTYATPPDLSPYRGQKILPVTWTPDSRLWNTWRTVVTGKELLQFDTYGASPTDPWGTGLQIYDSLLAVMVAYTPAVASGAAPVAVFGSAIGAAAGIQFDTALDGTSIPDASAFSVNIDGVSYRVPDLVTVSGTSVNFNLPLYLPTTAVISATYTQPATGRLRDSTGTFDVASFTLALTNSSVSAVRFRQAGSRVFVSGARYSAPSQRVAGRGGGGF